LGLSDRGRGYHQREEHLKDLLEGQLALVDEHPAVPERQRVRAKDDGVAQAVPATGDLRVAICRAPGTGQGAAVGDCYALLRGRRSHRAHVEDGLGSHEAGPPRACGHAMGGLAFAGLLGREVIEGLSRALVVHEVLAHRLHLEVACEAEQRKQGHDHERQLPSSGERQHHSNHECDQPLDENADSLAGEHLHGLGVRLELRGHLSGLVRVEPAHLLSQHVCKDLLAHAHGEATTADASGSVGHGRGYEQTAAEADEDTAPLCGLAHHL